MRLDEEAGTTGTCVAWRMAVAMLLDEIGLGRATNLYGNKLILGRVSWYELTGPRPGCLPGIFNVFISASFPPGTKYNSLPR